MKISTAAIVTFVVFIVAVTGDEEEVKQRWFGFHYPWHDESNNKQCRIKTPKQECINHPYVAEPDSRAMPSGNGCSEKKCDFTPTTGLLYHNRQKTVTIVRPFYNQQKTFENAKICRNLNYVCCPPRDPAICRSYSYYHYGCYGCGNSVVGVCKQDFIERVGLYYVTNFVNSQANKRLMYSSGGYLPIGGTYLAYIVIDIPNGCQCKKKKLLQSTQRC